MYYIVKIKNKYKNSDLIKTTVIQNGFFCGALSKDQEIKIFESENPDFSVNFAVQDHKGWHLIVIPYYYIESMIPSKIHYEKEKEEYRKREMVNKIRDLKKRCAF